MKKFLKIFGIVILVLIVGILGYLYLSFNFYSPGLVEVEIDETKYFHRKYHRGEWRQGHWVFGGVERGTGRCFMVEVPDRRAETLTPIIRQWILPGSHIVSDGWRSYRGIVNIDNGIYTHSTIIHERNFVDPNDATVHTQNVENLWMRAKKNFVANMVQVMIFLLHIFMNSFGETIFVSHCSSI